MTLNESIKHKECDKSKLENMYEEETSFPSRCHLAGGCDWWYNDGYVIWLEKREG